MNLKAMDRVIDTSDLDLIRRALNHAETEIHNPGNARTNNFDVLDLIDQARDVVKRTTEQQWAVYSDSVQCPHCHWGFAPSVINQHIREKH